MIFGVGTDILAVSRIRILESNRQDPFFTSVFTKLENEESAHREDPIAYLAGRFAAKEAVYKCLRLSGDADFQQIEVITDRKGAPEVVLHGALLEYARRFNIVRIHLSISHETNFAVAYAIAESEQ